MKRDINCLKKKKFDVLVVGGGIHGVSIAREVALKGYKTALIEMRDFGHATSANSLKIIHGGLRYLQQADIGRMRQSVRSRKIFQKVAPFQTRTIPFVIPTYGHGVTGKESMAVALRINDIISWDRNREIPPQNYIPASKIISKEELLRILPDIEEKGLRGGAVWYECMIDNAERLILEFLLDVERLDVAAANYIKALRFIINHNKVNGVVAQDCFGTSEEFEIHSRLVVYATGPWIDDIMGSLPQAKNHHQKWAKAVNIIINKRLFPDYAVGLESSKEYDDQGSIINKGRRLYFFVPWREHTMIGTLYKPYFGSVDNHQIEGRDIVDLIEEVNTIYPAANLKWEDVTFFHVGLLPMTFSNAAENSNIQLAKHSEIIDHSEVEGIEGILSVRSVKFTTAPVIGEQVVKHVLKKYKPNPSRMTPSGSDKLKNENTSNVPSNIKERLRSIYGERAGYIMEIMRKDRQLEDLICEIPKVTKAEIIYLIREEMAVTLEDVVMRRTGMGTLGRPGEESLASIASVTAEELSWDDDQKIDEINKVLDHYSLLEMSRSIVG